MLLFVLLITLGSSKNDTTPESPGCYRSGNNTEEVGYNRAGTEVQIDARVERGVGLRWGGGCRCKTLWYNGFVGGVEVTTNLRSMTNQTWDWELTEYENKRGATDQNGTQYVLDTKWVFSPEEECGSWDSKKKHAARVMSRIPCFPEYETRVTFLNRNIVPPSRTNTVPLWEKIRRPRTRTRAVASF